MEWQEPTWLSYRKHRPPPGLSWAEIVWATKEGPAFYHPNVVGRIEELEMLCVRTGEELGGHAFVRDFWLRFDFVVGASKGEETHYFLAEWASSGDVHGRPISAEELRRKGARVLTRWTCNWATT
jgi:hypothetical protein